MLSWWRVALTFSLCGAPPRTRSSLTTAGKKCKTDKCILGGQREKANRPVPGSPPTEVVQVSMMCLSKGPRADPPHGTLSHLGLPRCLASGTSSASQRLCDLGLSYPIHGTGAQTISKTVEGLEGAGVDDNATEVKRRDTLLGSGLKL